MNPSSPASARPPQRPLGTSQQPNIPSSSVAPPTPRHSIHSTKLTLENAPLDTPHRDRQHEKWSKAWKGDLTRKRDSGTTIITDQPDEGSRLDGLGVLDVTDQSLEDEADLGCLSMDEGSLPKDHETSLEELPFHILLEIVTYLPTGDILEFACCSQALHEVARSPSTWQRLYYRHAGWQIRRPIRPDLRVQTEIDEPSTDTLDWRMLCRERQELEERWIKTRFTPRKLAVKPAKSAVYCSFALENYIITGSRNRSICFYEYDQDKRSLLVIFKIKEAHAGSVLCMVVDPAGAGGAGTMYTGGSDGKVNVWDLAEFLTEWDTFKGIPKLVGSLKGHCGGVLDLVIDDYRVLSCSKDGTVRVWCRQKLNSLAQVDLLGGPINCISLHPETGILVAAGCHGKITFYNLEEMKPLQKSRCQSRETVACVGFYEDLLVWGDTHLRVARMKTGRIMFEQSADTELIRCFTIMSRTGRVVTGSYSNQIQNRRCQPTPGRVLTISATATKIIAGDDQGNLVIQDFGHGLVYDGYFD